VPEKIAMSISGHKTRAIFDRYNIVNEADIKQAAERLHQHITAKREQRKEAAAESNPHTIGTQARKQATIQ
jgi:hypothetical protein